jgi:hypothetical protein
MRKITAALIIAAFSILGAASGTLGQEEAAELAKAAQNPVGDLISLPLQNNTNFGLGHNESTQNILNVQPVWPIGVGPNWNVITRTIAPLISQPAFSDGDTSTFGLGDITFTAFLSPKAPGRVIWGVGPVVLIPTATNDRLGTDKWGLGPSVVLLAMPGNWVVGSLFSNVWSVGGSGEERVNLFTWQYFLNYNLPNGWYLVSAPILQANWESESGNRWTVPVGGGAGKIFRIGRQPINGQLGAYYNVTRPDFGAKWQLRAQIQLLFPK